MSLLPTTQSNLRNVLVQVFCHVRLFVDVRPRKLLRQVIPAQVRAWQRQGVVLKDSVTRHDLELIVNHSGSGRDEESQSDLILE